jgi:predicted nucleic acid-binding protein
VTRYLLDTGPLVALLDRRDRHHQWARGLFETLEPPVYSCEPVLTEACFLVSRIDGGHEAVFKLLAREILVLAFDLSKEVDPLQRLIRKFADVPMSLADACLVRMTELDASAIVVTLDSHFRIYRRNRRQTIPALMPS